MRVYVRINLDAASSPPSPVFPDSPAAATTATTAATAGALSKEGANKRSGFCLPVSVLNLVNSVSGYAAATGSASKDRAEIIHRRLLRDQVQQYLHSLVTHEHFPALLAATVAKADQPAIKVRTSEGIGEKDSVVHR